MQWNNQQAAAMEQVRRWLASDPTEPFKLWGFAGTGKTTCARTFAEGVEGKVLFAAFTGKAAHVMRQAGCPDATTLHSLIYVPCERSRVKLTQLLRELEQSNDAEESQRLQGEIDKEKKHLKSPMFVPREDSPLETASLLIIDECSMVGEDMAKDLMSFGVPILVLGDPAQLPPVRGTGYFTSGKPDVMLTEIHRQAKDNPIIELATRAREGQSLALGTYGDSRVVTKDDFDPDAVRDRQQVLVGKNVTRKRANARIRTNRGFTCEVEPGDRLVCLRNDHDLGLLNGATFTVLAVHDWDEDIVGCTVVSELDGEGHYVEMHGEILRGGEVDGWLRREAQEFAHGYALTVHKAQGSQWRDVVLVDESRCFGNDRHKWLYTGLTRASETITVVKT